MNIYKRKGKIFDQKALLNSLFSNMKKENPKKSERKINASSGDFWGADRFSNAEYQEPDEKND